MNLRLSLSLVIAAAASAPAMPAAAQDAPAPSLSLEHRMLVRCSAAFALVAHRQAQGEEWALAYPSLDRRGREFFVRASARVIDEAGLDRAQMAAALTAEAQALRSVDDIRQVMPACVTALENAGL